MNIAEYKRILGMTRQIKEGDTCREDCLISDMSADYRDSIVGINTVLFGVQKLQGISTKGEWLESVGSFVREQTERNNQIDRDFYHVLAYAQLADTGEIIKNTRKAFLKLDEMTRQRYISFYRDFSHFFGELDPVDGREGAIEERVKLLKQRNRDFKWLYERLCDYRSKRVLSNIVGNWISFDISLITGMKENSFVDYFDPDVFSFSDKEVIVDLGAYIGDTALEYIENIGSYKRIYCYEITKESARKLKKNLSFYPDIVIRNCGASDKKGTMTVGISKVRASANRLGVSTTGSSDEKDDEKNGDMIEVVTLDEDIGEKITFLKMDIEGAEQMAIRGCTRHIKEDRPKLAISVYHSNSDIITIPRLIDSIRDDYRFYLRSHGNQWAPSEITLMGV